MLKTYRATTMAEALAEVKRDLGRDAVILHTRNVRKGGLFGLLGGRCVWEVTASANVNVPSRVHGRYVSEESVDLSAGKSCFDVGAPSGETQPQQQPAPTATLVQDIAEDTDQAERRSILSGEAGDAPSCVAGVSPASGSGTSSGMVVPPMRPEGVSPSVIEQTGHGQDARQTHGDGHATHGPDARDTWPRELLEFHAHLLRQDVDEPVADELIHSLAMSLSGVQADAKMIADRLCDLIADRIKTAGPVDRKPSLASKPRVIALVGPTGVGKTTTIAKLAADLKLSKKLRVGLVTMDTYRIAAVDQLRVYAEIIEVPLRTVLSAGEMHQAIYGMDADVVLIDTAGRSQNDSPRLNELRAFLAAADADEVHLVISATASRRTAMTILHRFGPLGPNRVILTKLDEAETFGTILSFPAAGAPPLSFATIGQDVPDDIEPADAWRLAQRILKGN